jgi:hypothetical protein
MSGMPEHYQRWAQEMQETRRAVAQWFGQHALGRPPERDIRKLRNEYRMLVIEIGNRRLFPPGPLGRVLTQDERLQRTRAINELNKLANMIGESPDEQQ